MGPHNLLGCNVVVDIYGENNTTKPNVKSLKWVFTYSGSSQPSELQRCGWSLGSQLCTSQAPPFHPLARSPEVSFCHILLIGKIGWSHKNRLTFSNQADLGWNVTKINWRFIYVILGWCQNKLTNLCRAVGFPTCSSPDFIWLTHLCYKSSKEFLTFHSDISIHRNQSRCSASWALCVSHFRSSPIWIFICISLSILTMIHLNQRLMCFPF